QFTRQYIGIYLRNQCNGNNISKNLLDNNNWYGLYFETECNNNILQGNEAFESEYGIYIHNNCDYNKIIENVANHNDYYGIYIYRYCDHNNITKNIANSNYDYGLYLFFLCKYNNITNNILINNNYYGIYLERACDHNIILNNTSKSQGYFYQYKGIFLQGCGHNLIKNNNLSYNLCGIELWSSCFNNIIENEIYHNYWGGNGIVLQVFSSYNNIINNSIYGEGNGIFLSQSYNCRIFNNNLFDITELGIEIRNTNGTILSGNKMKGNGIFLDGDFDQLTKFTIYTNNTVNGKPIYYYVNKTGLGKENFTNAGQIILINCNNSLISDLNVSNSSIGISSYYSVNLRILNNTIFFSKKCGIYLYKTNYSTIINNNFKGINPDIIEVDCEGNIFDQPSINPIIYDEDDDQKEEKKLDRNAFTLNFLLILGSISIITLLLFYYYLMINKLHRNHYFNKNKKLKTGLGIFPTTRAIMEEIIEESSFFQLLEGEISASNTESLKKINLERVSEELLENIALIKMSKSNKKEFIIELLALSDDERLMIINSILNRNNSNNILD
ncbi:MAG: NosD domain-containing protein, partial [Promethearchaeota archaeon]